MRDHDVLTSALGRCCRENLRLLIPDIAGFELSKGSEPFDTWQRSLEVLSGYSEFVSVSRKLPYMLDEERQTGQPCKRLAEDYAADKFREVLATLADGDQSSLHRVINGPVREKIPSSLPLWNDLVKDKQWITTVRDDLRSAMSDDTLKKLRRSPDSEMATWLSSGDGILYVYEKGMRPALDASQAIELTRTRSVYAAFVSGFVAIGLYWLAFGGLDSVAPERLSNDIADLDYAVTGSLSVGLLSKDTRLNTIYQSISVAANARCARFCSGTP